MEICLCMGSSCFSRGNKKTLQAIKEYLNEHGLTDQVVFKGSHCMGSCEKGPVVRIQDKTWYQVDLQQLPIILDQVFSGK